ncbi:MAG: TetR/AcrR family transcriptional regulator, partial [Oscillospiraceae bacterium]|nr:TetR/AcrR family transcriptional regulator [Oscillospiraceae bacterium]
MPPKAKITEKEIINAAVQLVREQGAGSLNARALANCLGCSTQPIFSNFAGMEEVLSAVIRHANELYNTYLKEE